MGFSPHHNAGSRNYRRNRGQAMALVLANENFQRDNRAASAKSTPTAAFDSNASLLLLPMISTTGSPSSISVVDIPSISNRLPRKSQFSATAGEIRPTRPLSALLLSTHLVETLLGGAMPDTLRSAYSNTNCQALCCHNRRLGNLCGCCLQKDE